jgi:uncharacterized protein (TIGR02444 family)
VSEHDEPHRPFDACRRPKKLWRGRCGARRGYSASPSQLRCRIAPIPTALWCGWRGAWGSTLATDETRELAGEAFWRFSLAFYDFSGVSEALIALQDSEGLDVNLILFALWVGISGRGLLDRDTLMAADRAVFEIRTEIVQPLRMLRRKLAESPDIDVQELRRDLKALELASEKMVQTRLAHLAGPVSAMAADITAAHANLAVYLGPDRVLSAEAAVIRGAISRFVNSGAPNRQSRPSA